MHALPGHGTCFARGPHSRSPHPLELRLPTHHPPPSFLPTRPYVHCVLHAQRLVSCAVTTTEGQESSAGSNQVLGAMKGRRRGAGAEQRATRQALQGSRITGACASICLPANSCHGGGWALSPLRLQRVAQPVQALHGAWASTHLIIAASAGQGGSRAQSRHALAAHRKA